MTCSPIARDTTPSPADGWHDPPSAPAGWEHASLIALREPAGGALAWVSPGHGGNTIGFAVWLRERWRQVLFLEGPDALRNRPTRYGCPILFPFPGYARDARYDFEGVRRTLPVNGPDRRSHVHGFAHDRPWRVVETRKESATLELATPRDLTSTERDAYPYDITVRQSVSLSDEALTIRLEATNDGVTNAPVGLGLHPYIDPRLFDCARSDVRVSLPGTQERILDGSVPTGELRCVKCELSPPDMPGSLLVCITDLWDAASASVQGSGDYRVQCDLIEGWSDLVVYVPPDQPSVALEPLTCALSAASINGGAPGAIPGLPPGRSISAVLRLKIEPERAGSRRLRPTRSQGGEHSWTARC